MNGSLLYYRYCEACRAESWDAFESLTGQQRAGWDELAVQMTDLQQEACIRSRWMERGRILGLLQNEGVLGPDGSLSVERAMELLDAEDAERTMIPFGLTREQHEQMKAFVAEMNSPERFLGGPCLVVGKVYKLHGSDRLVRITGGQYLSDGGISGEPGRISNFWDWDFVNERHEPTGESGSGYGWAAVPVRREG